MKNQRQQYWSQLQIVCKEKNAPLTLNAPPNSNSNRIGANLGPHLNLGFRVEVLMKAEIPGVNQDNIAVRISVPADSWKAIEKWGNITEEFDSKSLIKLVEKGKYKGGRQIILYKDNVDPEDESTRADQFEWFVENLSLFAELFRSCFRPGLPEFRVPKGKSKDQQVLPIDDAKEYRLTPNDLLTLQKILQDLQTLLAKYDI